MPLGPAPPADHPIRRASWIWPEPAHLPRHNVHAHFHRVLRLDEVPASAPCHVTADAQYVLRVNGRYANRGPARGFQTAWPFDTHDITRLLRPGENVVAATVYCPGHGTFSHVDAAAAGLLMAIELPGGDVLTDGSWSTRLDPTHGRLTPMLSVQMSHQEQVDLRAADGWEEAITPTDDAAPDAPDPLGAPASAYAWHPPGNVHPFGRPPWNDLTERGVPPLTSNVLPYGDAVATATGPADAAADPTAAWWAYHRALSWDPAPAAPAPVPAGGVAVRLYDLGHVRLGTAIVEAPAAEGVRVDLLYVQAVDESGVPILDDPGVGSRISLANRLILGPDPHDWEAFLPMGHRQLAVVVHGPAPAIDLAPKLRETVYPLNAEGSFDTDEQSLNEIWNLCRVTQRACLSDAYTDTPWREQAQWWGDARVQSQNTFHLVPDDRPLVRGVRQIGHQRLPNGLTYGHAPTVAHSCVLPDFTLTWLLTLWDHFWQTGDPSLLLEQEDGVRRALDYFRPGGGGMGDDGLLKADPRYWLFLDWCDVHKEGTPTLLNLWHAWALDAVAGVYAAAGRDADAAALRAERSAQLTRMDELLFDAERGLYRDGLADDGEPVDRFSVQNQTLALLAGLHDPAPLQRRVADCLGGELHGGANPSSYWITYLYDAAERAGLERPMLDHIRRHWTPMLPHGGCWESFETPAKIRQESVSHAWAAHPLFHLMRALGGVRQAAPAWSEVLFRPVLDRPEASRAATAWPTPRGVLRSRWSRDGGTAAVTLEVPEGVTARIELPGVPPASVGAGTHRWSVGIQSVVRHEAARASPPAPAAARSEASRSSGQTPAES
ncbi:alpha-L-rhamnosidase-related protein [Phycisphaera mikurensis]|uniref:Alpha-L-rhamnosidase n=1 Tax=Phycisphaera mikurensis (strain NBRC 102666 / KCTC 22515 / FYK2301M01) TaxID=1142394 RepID=I0IHZ0_PHYMF|nr:alpha-L-rhamnosidase C-terminal domain-containing protein [Phycisphaera mikurensis]MBB6441116.1 hypothetical protein [Phycisphaera mikurensis]BAM04878.1 hypothetical protein PSMK_27190 [Phycisphaera mikurensis NBRC 102666]